MVTVKLQAVDQATLQIIETPQFLQAFSIDSPDFPCRDPAISSPRSFYGQNICSVLEHGFLRLHSGLEEKFWMV